MFLRQAENLIQMDYNCYC